MTTIPYEKSFASHPKAIFWHQTKNEKNPCDMAKHSHTKCWFTCEVCNHDFDYGLNTINSGCWCPYCVNRKLCNDINCKFCLNNSFASHTKSQFWHITKNKPLIARNVFKNYNTKCWFTCEVCNHDFDATLNHVINETWCPYCSIPTKKFCNKECDICLNKTFASHPKAIFWHPTKNDKTPREVLLFCNSKFWFKCGDCKHDFETYISHVSNDMWCSYCVNYTRCEDTNCEFCYKHSFASHPKAQFWHPTLNGELIPRNISIGNKKKCWFKCNVCSNDFDTSLCGISGRGVWCPACVNKTEKKLLEYLNNQYPNEVKFQPRYDWCKNPDTNCYLPFDFEIFGSILIELDGPQHIDKQVANWKSPEEHQERDMYKMEQALNNNKHLIRILQEDVFNDTYDWREKLNNAILSLNDDLDTKIKCIGDCDVYREYTLE